MKKILLLSVIIVNVFALSCEEKLLLAHLFTELFHKPVVKIYSKEIKSFAPENIVLVKNCNNADLILGKSDDKNCSKPVFVLDYYDYKSNKNAIGAFYWRKGRPQVRLRKRLILKYHLYVTDNLKDFLE